MAAEATESDAPLEVVVGVVPLVADVVVVVAEEGVEPLPAFERCLDPPELGELAIAGRPPPPPPKS